MTQRGWILFLALSVIWGVPYLLIRIAVAEIDPLVVAFGRTTIGALLLLPVALRANALAPAFRNWKPLLAFTLVEINGPWLLLGHAETRLTSSTAGLLIAIVPLIAAVILTRLGHDRFGARRLLGLGLGFAGVAALVGLDIHLDDLPAVGAVVLTSIGYAIGPIIIDRKLGGVPPLGVVTASLILASLLYAPFAPFLWPHEVSLAAGGSVVALAVFCTATAFLLFFALIAEAGPGRATVITYINPAVALLLGVIVLHEPLTAGMAIGFPLVILGSILGTSKSATPPSSGESRDAMIPESPSA
ncbi:DMT family transporter [Dokdonella sp.]|uniref:DMT family transporter n=1 Tax=Dokdonella sp. TaxID=2291710 RepID=UPI002F3F8D50